MLVIVEYKGRSTELDLPGNTPSNKAHAELCNKLAFKPARTRFFVAQVDVDCSIDVTADTKQCKGVKYCSKARTKRVYLDSVGDRRTLESYVSSSESKPGIATSTTTLCLSVKDIGPQFSYRGVFLLEYAGPLVIWFLLSLTIKLSTPFTALATFMWTFHYVKRLLESIFVHTFSNKTMPLRNLVKNCTYYWGFAAAIAWNVLRSNTELAINIGNKAGEWERLLADFKDTKDYSHVLALSKSVSKHLLHEVSVMPPCLFLVSELLNLYCHLKLRYLRPAGSREHFLPKGFLFNRIACPNYTTEILSWFFFTLYTRSWVSAAFNLCGACQMYVWASQKRARLVQEFPEAKGRYCIFPLL